MGFSPGKSLILTEAIGGNWATVVRGDISSSGQKAAAGKRPPRQCRSGKSARPLQRKGSGVGVGVGVDGEKESVVAGRRRYEGRVLEKNTYLL